MGNEGGGGEDKNTGRGKKEGEAGVYHTSAKSWLSSNWLNCGGGSGPSPRSSPYDLWEEYLRGRDGWRGRRRGRGQRQRKTPKYYHGTQSLSLSFSSPLPHHHHHHLVLSLPPPPPPLSPSLPPPTKPGRKRQIYWMQGEGGGDFRGKKG
jgi:hypothetical protein